ncbi:MAG TPA: family 20 glycosylhydrolase [Silvibacterium sp.]|nr:family 20 glycosylhydrolase [Silvibacterium sp.]
MLRRTTLALFAGTLFAMSAMAQDSSTFVNTLMPEPAHLSAQSGTLPLTASFTAATSGFHDQRLDDAISRTLDQLESHTGLQIATAPASSGSATLTISVDGPGEAIQSLDEDETYSLDVTPTGAHLKSATDVGAMHGLETFLQLVQNDGSNYFLPAVSIQDTPRFRWRGLMIDCSRHFEPIPVIKRTLDGMAAVKLNVFHWHLSDDQGFRIESKIFPKLTEMGSNGQFYTQDQAREIVAYARARGIRVVPEFDIPGHAQSWYAGYPELASAPGPYQIQHEYGIFDPVMDPTQKSTYKFLDKFVGEMAEIFPDPYFHVGGDENNGVQWKNNPRIQEFMQKHDLHGTAGLQTYFNQQLLPILKKHGKIMVGWDEIFAPGLSKDAIIQSWRGFSSLAASAKQGYNGLLSHGYYLDQIQTAGEHYLVDPLPADTDLTPDQKAHILGGEACMWGEHVSPRSIDSRIWPRTAAIAERLWSPQSVNNVDDMYRRLWIENLRLEALGLTQLSNEDVGLRQLAGTTAIEPLRILASVLQPIGFDQRYEMQHTSQLTPMDHLIDAVRPDPPSLQGMQLLVHRYLTGNDPDAGVRLEAIFNRWLAAGPAAESLMNASPLLKPAAPRGQQLVDLGTTGQQALNYLAKHQAAPAGWAQDRLALIDQAQKPAGLVRFTVLDPLRELVKAVQQ